VPAPDKRSLPGRARAAVRYRVRQTGKARASQELTSVAAASLSDGHEGVLDCIFAANEHGAYCVPRSAYFRPAAQTILSANVWEARTIEFIRGVPGNVVTAGTFFGDFLPALSRSRPDHTVWAFEPNRESFRCASVTLLLNDAENVHLRHAGLTDAPGGGFVRTVDASGRALGGGSRLVEQPDERGEAVPLATIDEVVDEPLALIHLDVEGHERQALTGAMRTIERDRPLLVLETLPDADWVAQHLTPLGYAERSPLDDNHVLTVGELS
jgi:FkbM family methyltransferase